MLTYFPAIARRVIVAAASVIAFDPLTPAPAAQQRSAPQADVTVSNPLIAPWTGAYGGVPPWDQAKAEHFPGAFEAALAQQRAEIDAIVAARAAENFENSNAAMQRSGRTLDRVGRLFGVMRDNVTTTEIQKLDR